MQPLLVHSSHGRCFPRALPSPRLLCRSGRAGLGRKRVRRRRRRGLKRGAKVDCPFLFPPFSFLAAAPLLPPQDAQDHASLSLSLYLSFSLLLSLPLLLSHWRGGERQFPQWLDSRTSFSFLLLSSLLPLPLAAPLTAAFEAKFYSKEDSVLDSRAHAASADHSALFTRPQWPFRGSPSSLRLEYPVSPRPWLSASLSLSPLSSLSLSLLFLLFLSTFSLSSLLFFSALPPSFSSSAADAPLLSPWLPSAESHAQSYAEVFEDNRLREDMLSELNREIIGVCPSLSLPLPQSLHLSLMPCEHTHTHVHTRTHIHTHTHFPSLTSDFCSPPLFFFLVSKAAFCSAPPLLSSCAASLRCRPRQQCLWLCLSGLSRLYSKGTIGRKKRRTYLTVGCSLSHSLSLFIASSVPSLRQYFRRPPSTSLQLSRLSALPRP